MKKFLVIISFTLLTFFAKGQTWVYHPMPESNATWNFSMYIPCPPIVTLYEYYSITMTGDTIINGQTYHKLFTPYVGQSYSGTTCGVMYPGYKGAIRQDSALKKVFFIPYDTVEYLLYDFNMQVGDTLQGYIAPYSSYDTVISIDSILVGSNYRKIWFLNQYQGIYFIEGVGSTYGLTIGSAGGAIGTFPYWSLNCFSQDGISLFDTTSSCPLITSIDSKEKTESCLSIFPNPFNDFTTIKFENSKNETLKLILINQFGQTLKEIENVTTNEVRIDNNNFPSGFYFIILKRNEQIMGAEKLIIN